MIRRFVLNSLHPKGISLRFSFAPSFSDCMLSRAGQRSFLTSKYAWKMKIETPEVWDEGMIDSRKVGIGLVGIELVALVVCDLVSVCKCNPFNFDRSFDICSTPGVCKYSFYRSKDREPPNSLNSPNESNISYTSNIKVTPPRRL